MIILIAAGGVGGCGTDDDSSEVASDSPAQEAGKDRQPEQAGRTLPDAAQPGAARRAGKQKRRRGSRRGLSPETPAVAAAVQRYLHAINERDLEGLCSRFAELDPGDSGTPACKTRGAPGGDRHPPQIPGRDPAPQHAGELGQVALRSPPRVVVSDDKADATVKLVAISKDGRRSFEREVIALRRAGPGWMVAGPSPVFARAFESEGAGVQRR